LPQDDADEAELGPYDVFEIVKPESNATIRDEAGKISVALVLDPPLMPSDHLRIEIDGQLVEGDASGTQIELTGLSFGSHSIRAVVIDEFEVPIARTLLVHFHLRKPSAEEPAL